MSVSIKIFMLALMCYCGSSLPMPTVEQFFRSFDVNANGDKADLLKTQVWNGNQYYESKQQVFYILVNNGTVKYNITATKGHAKSVDSNNDIVNNGDINLGELEVFNNNQYYDSKQQAFYFVLNNGTLSYNMSIPKPKPGHGPKGKDGMDNDDAEINKLQVWNGNQYYEAKQQVFYILVNTGTLAYNISVPKIPKGYKVTDGVGAHKLMQDKKSWNEARKACMNDGGHLAVIDSEEEDELIREMHSESNVKQAWLGMHDHFSQGDWTSVHNKPIDYARWREGAPSSQGAAGRCIAYTATAETDGLNDERCESALPFVCEIALN